MEKMKKSEVMLMIENRLELLYKHRASIMTIRDLIFFLKGLETDVELGRFNGHTTWIIKQLIKVGKIINKSTS